MPTDWVNYLESDYFENVETEYKQYLKDLYYSVLGLNINELGP